MFKKNNKYDIMLLFWYTDFNNMCLKILNQLKMKLVLFENLFVFIQDAFMKTLIIKFHNKNKKVKK